MSTIVTRAGKGSPLTHNEMDANFTNLNTGKLEKTSADFTPQIAPAYQEGRVWYDSDEKALSYYNDISQSSMQVGFEQWIRVRNNTGSTITDGSVVVITGATGQVPTIALADADTHTAAQVIGLVTADIANNSIGHVTTNGLVKGLNTSGFSDGATVYLSQTPGALTATAPTGNAAVVSVGIVAHSHVTQGKILVSVNNAKEYSNVETAVNLGNISGPTEIDIALGTVFYGTIVGDIEWSITNTGPAGTVTSFILEVNNAAGFTSDWATSMPPGTTVYWPDGLTPVTTTGKDILVFMSRDGGVIWYGFIAGLDVKEPV